MNENEGKRQVHLPFFYCLKWWIHYHRKSLKGRFEVYHFLEWLLFMTGCIAVLEAVLYVWLNV